MSLLPATWNEAFPRWSHAVGLPERWHDLLGPGPRDEEELAFARAVEESAKIELHVHAEAAVPASFYEALNAREGLYEPGRMPASRAPFASLRDFIGAWIDNTKLLREPAVFEEMIVAFARARAEQGIAYTEAHVSPCDFSYMRERFPLGAEPLGIAELLRAYARGASTAAELFPSVYVRFTVDALWIALPSEHERMLEALASVVDSDLARDPRGGRYFTAVGLGGPEASAHAEAILPFADGARKLGLKLDAHSGENNAPAEHRHSVETLAPDRVGHGIQGASEGYFFPGHIAACPLSNLLTGSWTRPFSEHPVAKLAEAGHPFSIGSDDPLLFRNTLTLEFVALRRAFGFGIDFVERVRDNALAAAFDPAAARAALEAAKSARSGP